MDARFYNVDDLDIQQIANNLENIYRSQGYQTQQVGSQDQVMVQLKKGGDLEMLIGLQAALSVIIQKSGGGVIAMIGQQKWMDKAAVGAIGLVAAPVLWPLMLTAGAGAIRQASLGNQVLNVVDGLVRQQRPEAQIGPVPVQVMPQIQQQWAPPPQYLPPPAPMYTPPPQYASPTVVDAAPVPAPAPVSRGKRLRCPDCNTPYEPGDTFCTGCGRPLITICPNCKTEVKDNAAFCPKCGATLYQATTPQAARPASSPATPPAPVYTPPPAPKPQPRPETPVYTPPPAPAPAAPQKPAYTPSPAQVMPPPSSPPTPVYTPPPATQEPAAPKPTITYIPGTTQQTPPAPKQSPRQPGAPYYTPPVSPQQVSPKPKTPQAPAPQPIQPKPAAQPAFNANAVWGYLTFSDGKQVKLAGERAIVGRGDHDIADWQPEVDLSNAQGADTVSRIHAALEHIGSAYTVTDLNSTNATRLNNKRLEPDKATPINDGDTIVFGKVQVTFKKA